MIFYYDSINDAYIYCGNDPISKNILIPEGIIISKTVNSKF